MNQYKSTKIENVSIGYVVMYATLLRSAVPAGCWENDSGSAECASVYNLRDVRGSDASARRHGDQWRHRYSWMGVPYPPTHPLVTYVS